MITDTDHVWTASTGELILTTRVMLGIPVVVASTLVGGDIVSVHGDLWRKFGSVGSAVRMGDHKLTPIAYQQHSDLYFAICRKID